VPATGVSLVGAWVGVVEGPKVGEKVTRNGVWPGAGAGLPVRPKVDELVGKVGASEGGRGLGAYVGEGEIVLPAGET
jgi:hypothetical protein